MPLWGETIRKQERARRRRDAERERSRKARRRREWKDRPVRTLFGRIRGR